MNKVVLDASAMLAVIHRERGFEKLTPELLARAIVSSVNLAEVHGKLLVSGWPRDLAWGDATSLVQEVLPFTADQLALPETCSPRLVLLACLWPTGHVYPLDSN